MSNTTTNREVGCKRPKKRSFGGKWPFFEETSLVTNVTARAVPADDASPMKRDMSLMAGDSSLLETARGEIKTTGHK